MGIALNKFLQEIESLSPGFLMKVENLYPLEFNIEVDSISKFSINLNHYNPSIDFFERPNPKFSLRLNIFTALNALINMQVPTKSISGDVESALILLGVLTNIDIDLELLIYKYFGDIPALILRKLISAELKREKYAAEENETNKVLKSFRDISIRLDRLEHVLIN